MRITQGMMSDAALHNMNEISERLGQLQDQLTSQQRVHRPSDDPAAVAASLGFQTDLEHIGQRLDNISGGAAWLNATDSALGSLNTVLQRAREIAVHGSSGTFSRLDQQTLANEVGQLIEQSVTAGNAMHGGQHLFAGRKTNVAPFSTVGSPVQRVVYGGDNGAIQREIDEQATMAINVTGDAAFPETFEALIELRRRLTAGDFGGVSQMIGRMDAAIDSVTAVRAGVGAKVNRLEMLTAKLEEVRDTITGLRSRAIDTDMVAAVTDYSTQQSVYEAALKVSARIMQSNLLDFLR